MLKKFLFVFSSFLAIQSLQAQVGAVSIDVVTMIEDNDAESFRHELEMGLDPNACLDDLSLLMIAAQLGRMEIVQDLLACDGIQTQAQDHYGNTALHFAVIFGYPEVVKLLVYADAPVDCSCEKRSHGRFAYQIKNRDGKSPADLAYSGQLQEMLANPDVYIKSHPEEFRKIAYWFDTTCPEKARARIRRQESWGERVRRTCGKAKDALVVAADKTAIAAKQAYEKTKDITSKTYKAGEKAKQKVDNKYDKAKELVVCHYEKAKGAAVGVYGTTCGYAATGLEKTKEVAANGYAKAKDSMKAAYQKAKERLVS